MIMMSKYQVIDPQHAYGYVCTALPESLESKSILSLYHSPAVLAPGVILILSLIFLFLCRVQVDSTEQELSLHMATDLIDCGFCQTVHRVSAQSVEIHSRIIALQTE